MKDKTRFAIALFAICLLGFTLLACEFSIGGGEPSVETVVMARSLGANYEPVETTNVFDPMDVFYCSVKVADLEEDSEVMARWFFGSEFLGEYTYTAEDAGSGYIGYHYQSYWNNACDIWGYLRWNRPYWRTMSHRDYGTGQHVWFGGEWDVVLNAQRVPFMKNILKFISFSHYLPSACFPK